MDSLFRPEVLRAQNGSMMGNINVVTPPAFTYFALVAVLIIISSGLLLSFGSYARRITVNGQLVSSKGIITIPAKITGTVSDVYVHVGERVTEGQPLVKLSATLISGSMGDTQELVSAGLRLQAAKVRELLNGLESEKKDQINGIRLRIKKQKKIITQIDGQLAMAEQKMEATGRVLEKVKTLSGSGIISEIQYNKYHEDALNKRSQVKDLKRERLGVDEELSVLLTKLKQLPADFSSKGNRLKQQLARINAQLAENEAVRSVVLCATKGGVISTLLVRAGESVKIGRPLMSILPNGSQVLVQLLVSGNAIGFVHPHDDVVLRYQGYPYQYYGLQHGKITQISYTALSKNEASLMPNQNSNAKDPVYRVLVRPEAGIIGDGKKVVKLRPGMILSADIILEHASLWRLFFGKNA